MDKTVWQIAFPWTPQCRTKLPLEPPNGTKTKTVEERAWHWIFHYGKKVGSLQRSQSHTHQSHTQLALNPTPSSC